MRNATLTALAVAAALLIGIAPAQAGNGMKSAPAAPPRPAPPAQPVQPPPPLDLGRFASFEALLAARQAAVASRQIAWDGTVSGVVGTDRVTLTPDLPAKPVFAIEPSGPPPPPPSRPPQQQ